MSSEDNNGMNRRRFLKSVAAVGGLMAYSQISAAESLKYFKPISIDNPLGSYPNREWEKAYRNIFSHDSHFHFLCAPNDTHNCLLKTFVKNDIAVRIGPSYGYGKAMDLYGNKASHRWDPRLCQKGLALPRRIYGDRRVKAPMIRKGYKDWIDAGFPRDSKTGLGDRKYFQRGKDKWLRVSWKDANQYMAKAIANIAKTYSGDQGAKYLAAQDYDSSMIEAMNGSGMQAVKMRGGMAFLGATRIFGMYRMANMLALADAKIRNVSPDKAKGARGWDSYSWHTDLPPGHPMVTGVQTNDFDLSCTEYANLIIPWGMNWITTKMPDSHWLTEARLKGAKVVSVTVEYSSTASKSDDVVMIRPGSDPAFALGLAQVIISKKMYDQDFVENKTDLPFLVRLDNLQPLKPTDVIAGYQNPEVKNIKFLKQGEKPDPNLTQQIQYASEAMKEDFSPRVVFDKKTKKLTAVTRDEWGKYFASTGVSPDLNYTQKIKLLDGKTIKVRTIFNMTKEYLDNNFNPKLAAKVTGTTEEAIVRLAHDIANNKEKTLFAVGMGPNQFFNSDLKDRAIFLVAALTRNIGFPGGNVGSYAGNYKASIFGGMAAYTMENPFNIQTKSGGKIDIKKYSGYDSLHYFNYGDRPLKQGNKMFTGKTHMPTPTKAMWQCNSNSTIGNTKWHYDFVINTLPRVELVCFQEWWWTGSCEYSDIVMAADSWAETKAPDMTASCTNPFVQIFPRTPLKRIFDTKPDIEIIAGVSKALGNEVGDSRLSDAWKFVFEGKVSEYIQRIIDGSFSLKGYKFSDLEEKAKNGIPVLANMRSYPRVSSIEQTKDELPWYTKTGRLEFYRHEPEFIEHGENLVVYREPVDSTHFEPNVIVAKSHEALRPKQPAHYGMNKNDLSTEARQVRNVMMSPDQLVKSKHPLKLKLHTHVYHTPKYRHGAHTTPVDTDYNSIWFGPFGDIYRHDKRMPSSVEGYVDINPLDAKALNVEDGDYVYIDADPSDRPYRNWKKGTEEYKLSRVMLRARYYPGTPRGIARTWHNMYGATFGSVKAHETRPDGLAKSDGTNYQAMYRYGSHQSATRVWLRPTLMTDTLLHKSLVGQGMAKGFEADVHCPVGAPRESFVKITKVEAGGIGGKGLYRPAALGFRPTYENVAMKEYLKGKFMKKKV